MSKFNFLSKLAIAGTVAAISGAGVAVSSAQASTFKIHGGLFTEEPGATPHIWPASDSEPFAGPVFGWDSHGCPTDAILPEDCPPAVEPLDPVSIKVLGKPGEKKWIYIDFKGSDAGFTNLFEIVDSNLGIDIKWCAEGTNGVACPEDYI